jgi:flagellar FliJ protein
MEAMQENEFSLQPVLSHKERLEDICQMELAEVEGAYFQECRRLELLREIERLEYEELQHQHDRADLDLGTIGVCFNDLNATQRRIELQLLLLQDLAEKVQRKRAQLIEISKDKKALEKLKEEHRKRIARAINRAEIKIADDIVTSQSYRLRMFEASTG